MDETARRHAGDLTDDIMEAVDLGFRDEDLRQHVACLSQRAFARAFPKTQQQDADPLPEATLPEATLPEATLPEEATPIG